jgi:hydrogenase maturation factor HypE
MRHDAAKFRENEKSERIRRELGIMTPEEKERIQRRIREATEAQRKKDQAGTALFDKVEP